jgi:hypothetical protein
VPKDVKESNPNVVRVPAARVGELVFSHVFTRVDVGTVGDGVCGTTKWACPFDRKQVYLSWAWSLVGRGAVCVSDALAIDSNLYIAGELPFPRKRRLLGIVQALDWEERCLQAAGEGPGRG